MQKKQLVLGICLGGMLLGGCSSKPDVGDVDAGLKKFWEPCKLVKATSFKKTNGADRGDKYAISISYKLEVTRDIVKEDIWNIPTSSSSRNEKFYSENCPDPARTYFKSIAQENHKIGESLNKGDTFAISTSFIMIKSEKGWIIQ
jgi:hypothetical protein